jgi:hypothetical protein
MASEYHAGPQAARTALRQHEETKLAQNIMIADLNGVFSLACVHPGTTGGEIAVVSHLEVVKLVDHG